MKKILFLPLLLLMTSCATNYSSETPFIFSGEFDESDVEWSKQTGKTTIEGSSFIVDRMGLNGTTHTCVGYSALLIPQNDYVEEYLNYLFDNLDESFWNLKGPIPFKNVNLTPAQGVRESKCDIDGKFEFKNVPTGTYYLSSTVYYVGGPLRTIPPDYRGGMFLKKIVVKDEDSMRVILTK